MAENSETNWEGKATAELKTTPADRVWPFVSDFCNLHKFFPNLDTCYQVDGELGKPGLVRYCSSTSPPSSGESDQTAVKWAKERLVIIDPAERCLSYEILDNNMGFKFYAATFRVVEGDGEDGSIIEWSFAADPVEGLRFEDFESYCDSCLQVMAKKIETLCTK